MTPHSILSDLEARGLRLDLRAGGLRLSGLGVPPADLVALIQVHRAGLIAHLEAIAARDLFEERAAILEHEAGFPRVEAEALARGGSRPP